MVLVVWWPDGLLYEELRDDVCAMVRRFLQMIPPGHACWQVMSRADAGALGAGS